MSRKVRKKTAGPPNREGSVPFNVGTRMFGPLHIKVNRDKLELCIRVHEIKAAHLENVNDKRSDGFFKMIHRFESLRGYPDCCLLQLCRCTRLRKGNFLEVFFRMIPLLI